MTRRTPLLLLAATFAASHAAALVPQASPLNAKECMGTWYVQHQKPALAVLESGGRNGIEEYTWDDAEDRFSVTYSFNRKGAADDQLTTVNQRGWVEADTEWRVAPLIGGRTPPFVRLPFIIIDCDPETHMVCSGGLSSWMYLMTRERQPDAALVDSLLTKVQAAGFDMSKVEPMVHDVE